MQYYIDMYIDVDTDMDIHRDRNMKKCERAHVRTRVRWVMQFLFPDASKSDF